jgi:hypothetical protein
VDGCEEPLGTHCDPICRARGLAGGSCAKPAVVVVSSADVSALENHLPAVVQTAGMCDWLVEASETLLQIALDLDPSTLSNACASSLSEIQTRLASLAASSATICQASAAIPSGVGF